MTTVPTHMSDDTISDECSLTASAGITCWQWALLAECYTQETVPISTLVAPRS